MTAAVRLAAAGLTALALVGCDRAPASHAVQPVAAAASAAVHLPFASSADAAAFALTLQTLAERVAVLERQRLQANAPVSPAAAAADPRAARRPSDAELRGGPPDAAAAALRDPQQLERERQAELDGLFRQEPVNAAWAGVTAAAVRQALPPPADGSALSLRVVECRSQTCRVEVAAVGSDAMRQGLSQLAQRLADRFPSMAVVSRYDGTGATLYFRS